VKDQPEGVAVSGADGGDAVPDRSPSACSAAGADTTGRSLVRPGNPYPGCFG
jgi:hypothetical protein